jgi:MFS family permease
MCGVVTYAMMNLVMTSAPLAMRMCGLPVSASNWAIQWHIVAMYGPSFFTGALITRFGHSRVVVAGMLLILAAAVSGLTGFTEEHFFAGLVLLGLGWNFGFVGASAMVLETHWPVERTRVQSFNDFLVFGSTAVGSFSSGQILANHGWEAVNWAVFPPVAVAVLVLIATNLFASRRGAKRAKVEQPG